MNRPFELPKFKWVKWGHKVHEESTKNTMCGAFSLHGLR